TPNRTNPRSWHRRSRLSREAWWTAGPMTNGETGLWRSGGGRISSLCDRGENRGQLICCGMERDKAGFSSRAGGDMTNPGFWWVGFGLLVGRTNAWAQPTGAAYKPPDDIAFRKATINSEGSRLSAECFSLKENEAKPLPTIIMSHGWGGVAASLRETAVDF